MLLVNVLNVFPKSSGDVQVYVTSGGITQHYRASDLASNTSIQSDVSDLRYKPIKLFKNREKVAVVVEEVKSEPLYYHLERRRI